VSSRPDNMHPSRDAQPFRGNTRVPTLNRLEYTKLITTALNTIRVKVFTTIT